VLDQAVPILRDMNSRALAVALTVSSLALTASPAMAKGGGGGGSTTPPAPTEPIPSLCPEYMEAGFIQFDDGSTALANEASGAGCLIAKAYPSGLLTLYKVVVAPGWTYTVKSSGGGSSNRVDVEFNNSATRERREILVQPGKTVIR
jgi:hypothetical protein